MPEVPLFADDATSWAHVIIPLAVPLTYTWAIPDRFSAKVIPGIRVEVELKNKRYAGVVRDIVQTKPAFAAREISNVLDEEPVLHDAQFKLWSWISEYYVCTEGEVMAAALPANYKLSSETTIVFNEAFGDDFSALDDEEFKIAEMLLARKEVKFSELQIVVDRQRVYPLVKRLIEKDVAFIQEELRDNYKPKTEQFLMLSQQYRDEAKLGALLNNWKGASKQMEILLSYLHLEQITGDVKQPELAKKSGASAAQIRALCDKGILVSETRRVDRLPASAKFVDVSFELSPAQLNAFNGIQSVFDRKKVCLLHGITGSGKTEIYIRLIEQKIEEGKQVLYLLPEIALTAQIIRRLQKHFGGHIAVYHSKFNDRERAELWQKVKSGETQIVLGARSSVFLPFSDLGLVIVDEEHEPSYKQQEPPPRYHARDAAIYFASLFGSDVLLGSATPSLESYANAETGKYGLVNLSERYGNIPLPEIKLVNIAQIQRPQGSQGKLMIGPQLQEELGKKLDEDLQSIIFQNRRGYNPYLICGTCGLIPKCEHCDVSLTMHKFSNKLHCHYCGSTYARLITCPRCGSTAWLEKNFGTEKLEEQLLEMFPKARIARMDVDSVKGKNAHDNLIRQFEQHKLDMLVGTQMVSKGLDFDNVRLIAIPDGDGLLSFTDFRVNERAFQLMIQVSGRAGRKGTRGEVLIQTNDINHPLFEFVLNHDYGNFYTWEKARRIEFGYPPFTRLIRLTLKHKDADTNNAAAEKLANYLRQDFGDDLTGPASPVVGRVRNVYLMEMMLRLPKDAKRAQALRKVILNQIALLNSERAFKSVQVYIDVDPA